MDQTALTIGPIEPDEYARVGALTVHAYEPSGLPSTDPYYRDLAAVAERVGQAEVLVARVDGEPVGTITWCPPGSPLQEIARPGECEIRMLAVDPTRQRLGIGTTLVGTCLERASALGCSAVVLSSALWMTSAHRLYTGLGFRRAPDRDWRPRPDVELLAYEFLLSHQS